jgi:hypothetical protein
MYSGELTEMVGEGKHNILASEQHGFRNNSSIQTASYNLLNVLLALNNKSIVGGIFCDLSKAFHCVDHDI